MIEIKKIGIKAKNAFNTLKTLSHKRRQGVLEKYNKLLLKNKVQILKENNKDIKSVKRTSLIDRLILNDKKIESIRNSINQIQKFSDPLGQILEKWRRPNKMTIQRVSTPIGVIGVIYESRPNVTADVAALCIKTGNCAILRGGSEALYSNKILAELFRASLKQKKIDENCVQFISNTNRRIVNFLLSGMQKYIDVIVPRGGKGLVAKVQNLSNVHVIGHLEGLCHLYIDNDSNYEKAKKIVLNSKLRRTSICGALETLLINERAIRSHGIPLINELKKRGCEILVDKNINKHLKVKLKLAGLNDWKTEYLDKKLSIKSVKNVNEAVDHIIKYGTMHTDGIITKNKKTAKFFLENVNSSIATHNVSTQFADGGEFGFGGEIGISTNKLPPRGPVGIKQLTSYKYILSGDSIIRP